MANEQEMNEQTAAPPPARGLRRRWILLAVVLAIATAAVVYWRMQAGKESTDDAEIDGHVHSISAKVGGTVLNLLVKDNQYVEAGTVLLEIDPKDYELALAKARADVAEAEAKLRADNTAVPIVSATTASQLSSARAGVEEQRATLAAGVEAVSAAKSRQVSAQARVARAKANSERAAKDLERYKALVAKEEIARQQYDAMAAEATATQAELDAAIAEEREAEQGVRMAQAQLDEKKAKLAKAEADLRGTETAPEKVTASKAQANSTSARLEQARTALELAELNVERTTLRAPVSGIVSERTVEVGQIVQRGEPLLAIVSLSDVWITANFKENQITNMRPGQKVAIHVDAYPGRTFQGKVDSLAAATGARFSLLPPENSTGNFVKVVQRVPVKIVFDAGQDPDRLLRPGLSVVPTVMTR